MNKKSKEGNSKEGQSEGVATHTIPLRSFQLKAKLHLKNLPLILTRYNKPIAKVTSFA